MTQPSPAFPPVQRLITHSGSFHADDVFAFIVLSRLFPAATMVRTRDRDLLAATDERDIVFDVGFVFDPDMRRYDHHQPGRPQRPEGGSYSSVGLVWKYHGLDYLRALHPGDAEDVLARAWLSLDKGFFADIDRLDNGEGGPDDTLAASATSLSTIVEDLVPNWDDEDRDYDAAFLRAADVFGSLLEAKVRRCVSRHRAAKAILEAFEHAEDPRIVVIPNGMPVGNVVTEYGFDEVLYLVEHNTISGDWYVNCVRPDGDPFGQRKSLPEEWAGLQGEQLAAVTGVEDAVFCHLKRFTCAARSFESAMQLARMAVEWKPRSEHEPSPIRRP